MTTGAGRWQAVWVALAAALRPARVATTSPAGVSPVAPAPGDHEGPGAGAAEMTATGAAAAAVAASLGPTLPALARTVAEIQATLRRVGSDGAQQLRAIETTLAAVQARNLGAAAEADRALAEMTALMTRIDQLSAGNTAALAKRAYALDAAIDGVLDRVTLAFDAIGARIDERLLTLETAVATAGGQLDTLSDAGAQAFAARLDLLLRTSERLRAELALQEAASVRLHGIVTGHVDALESRLAGLAEVRARLER